MAYTYLKLAQCKSALALRLADVSNLFWTADELGIYITEALRTWSSLTEQWNQDFSFTATSAQNWYNSATMAGSPRLRTVTDNDLYTVMQYHLLEPPTGGGAWTGTQQFSLADLQQALQRRRDEVIQTTRCNLANITLPSTARRLINLPDTTLEPFRIRFIPAPGQGNPVTLNCEDEQSFNAFEPDHIQRQAIPEGWGMASEPPLGFVVDNIPNVAGDYDIVLLQSGQPFNPPAASLMSMPDDWTWVAKWGALSDLLGRESEATDRFRADYCLKRYVQGLQAMAASNWIVKATINGVPCDTPYVAEYDAYSPEWPESDTAWPAVIVGGVDFVAVAPRRLGTDVLGVTVTLTGNAPLPANDAAFVQISRDEIDVLLDYAQHLAAFKMGGAEFATTIPLMTNFLQAAVSQNKRLDQLALFYDVLHGQGQRQNLMEPRQ